MMNVKEEFLKFKSWLIAHKDNYQTILAEKPYCIEIKSDFNDYSLAKRDLLLHTFFEIQDKYPLGKCLSHEIHKQFHKIYGYGNNTIEQWEHFVSQM